MPRRISSGTAGTGGAGTVAVNNTTISTVVVNGDLTLDATGTGTVNSADQVLITSGENSTQTTPSINGAVRVSGGMGVSGNVYVGGSLRFQGNGYNGAVTGAAARFTTLTVNGVTTFNEFQDHVAVKTGATGTVVHDFTESNNWVHNSMSANFTVNLTNVPTTNNRTLVITLYLNQGGTPYYANGFQIDGAAQTINWTGYNNPTAVASRAEIQTFAITRTGSTWYVVGALASYDAPKDGSSSAQAAPSAEAIVALNPSATNGVYWINLPTAGATQVYCNMTYSDSRWGRGWMLAGKVLGSSTVFNILSTNWQNVTTFGTATTINDATAQDMKNNVWNYYPCNVIGMSYQNGTITSTNWFTFSHRLTITMNAIFNWDNEANGFIQFLEQGEGQNWTYGATPLSYSTALGYGNIGGSPYGGVGLNAFMASGTAGRRYNATTVPQNTGGYSGVRLGYLGDNSYGGNVWPGQVGGPDDFALGIGIQSCYSNPSSTQCNYISTASPATHSRWDSQGWNTNGNFRPVNPHLWVK